MKIDAIDLKIECEGQFYFVSEDNSGVYVKNKKDAIEVVLNYCRFGSTLSYWENPHLRGNTFLLDLKVSPQAKVRLGEESVEVLETIIERHNFLLSELNKDYPVCRR